MSISIEHIQKAVRKTFPEAVVHGYTKFEKGYVNETLKLDLSKVDTPLVLKKFDADCEWKVGKEADVYHTIKTRSSVPVPQLYQASIDKTILPFAYLLMSEVPGQTLEQLYQDDATSSHLAQKAGRTLGKLHEIKFDGFGWIDSGGIYPARSWKEYFEHMAFQNISKVFLDTDMPKHLLHGAMDYFYEKRGILDIKDQPTLVHADFTSNNIKFEDDEVSGVLDVEWAFSGDKHYDFVKSKWYMPGGEDFQATLKRGYLERSELADNFEERLELYETEKAIGIFKFYYDRGSIKERKRLLDLIEKNTSPDK